MVPWVIKSQRGCKENSWRQNMKSKNLQVRNAPTHHLVSSEQGANPLPAAPPEGQTQCFQTYCLCSCRLNVIVKDLLL